MKVDVYIFRHGETDWNAQRRFQGHTDIFLNEKGRHQAKDLSKYLRELNLQVILSSDLIRAQETARIATEGLNIKMEITESLREAKLGEPEGQLRDDIVKIYGEDSWKKWLSIKPEDMDFSYPKGETKREQLTRALNYLENFFLTNKDIKVAGVSTHGGTVRRLIHNSAGAPEEAIPIPNCSLYKLEFNLETREWKYLATLSSGPAEKLFS